MLLACFFSCNKKSCTGLAWAVLLIFALVVGNHSSCKFCVSDNAFADVYLRLSAFYITLNVVLCEDKAKPANGLFDEHFSE